MQCKFIIILTFSCCGLWSHSAWAKVYTCMEHGEVVYTSNPKGNCAQAQLPDIGRYSDIRAGSGYRAATINSRPRNTGRIKTAYQGPKPSVSIIPRGSDDSRRAILQQELANERQALTQAQQALNRSRTGQGGNITELQSAVLDRQQNIQALQRELGRM
ncbi:hypothetical protein PT286_02265 [Neisseriaceae bacterium ESL0693]|nr:hypothetical protein [Neisseriaceae bacterium ESL0693]